MGEITTKPSYASKRVEDMRSQYEGILDWVAGSRALIKEGDSTRDISVDELLRGLPLHELVRYAESNGQNPFEGIRVTGEQFREYGTKLQECYKRMSKLALRIDKLVLARDLNLPGDITINDAFSHLEKSLYK